MSFCKNEAISSALQRAGIRFKVGGAPPAEIMKGLGYDLETFMEPLARDLPNLDKRNVSDFCRWNET